MNMEYLWQWICGRLTRQEANFLSDTGGYRMWFGKHAGRRLDDVWKWDPTYLAWFIRQDKTTCKQTQIRIKEYIRIKTKLHTQHYEPRRC